MRLTKKFPLSNNGVYLTTRVYGNIIFIMSTRVSCLCAHELHVCTVFETTVSFLYSIRSVVHMAADN